MSEPQWSVGELASLAGVSVRTLHHYDQIGLLAPAARGQNGRRAYDRDALERLYRILALRSLGLDLRAVAAALDDGSRLEGVLTLHLAEVERRIALDEATRDRIRTVLDDVRTAGHAGTDHIIDLLETTTMTVNLTRIYTKLGDGGETHLGDMSRVPKTHARIEAYGETDELNSHIGVTIAAAGDALPEEWVAWLRTIQNDLFDLGADLSVPEDPEATRERLRVTPEQTAWLEEACDEVNATLAPLKSFVLPGGTLAAAHLHVCRTVCRRAERRALAVDGANPEVVRYLNRLSDLLFILARGANAGGSEPLWEPGVSR